MWCTGWTCAGSAASSSRGIWACPGRVVSRYVGSDRWRAPSPHYPARCSYRPLPSRPVQIGKDKCWIRIEGNSIQFKFICPKGNLYCLHAFMYLYCLYAFFKGEIRNRFNLNFRRRVKNFKHNSENLMKIGWKIRKLWHFEVSQIFTKHFLTSRYEYAIEWVDDVITSLLAIYFVHKILKMLIFCPNLW